MHTSNPSVEQAQLDALTAFLGSKGVDVSPPDVLGLLEKLRAAASSPAAAKAAAWTVTAGVMTDAQYVDRRGLCCPSCGSGDISGNGLEADETGAWQDVHCKHCGAEWKDSFSLTGYSHLEGGLNLENVTAVVDDVKDRARKHEFNVDDEEQANDCVEGSAEILDLTLSAAEKKLAMDQLLE
ncbi:hypothetical protein DIE18_03675 [Burkholderia sp. Bp9125]|nr:hypothetical protein DIE18_03675 [Burkholderia sp. Bp9125]